MEWEIDTSDPMPGVMLRGRIIHKDCPNDPSDLWVCDEGLINETYEGSGWRRMRTVTVWAVCQGCRARHLGNFTEWAPEPRRNSNVPT